MKLRKSSHGIVYRIARLVLLGFYIASIVVLIREAGIPSKASGAKSDAAGVALSNIINDFNGDVAIEIIPEACEIVIPKTEFNVGESTTIKVETYPEETSYKSYIYSSSNPSVAIINEYGEISFLKAGSAQIRVENTKNSEVFATVDVVVKNVELESFTSKINAELKSGVYQLEVNSSYIVTNTFKPANATFKDVSYEYDETLNFITMDDDTITAVNISGDTTFDLVVRCGTLSNTLKLKTIKKEPVVEDYPLVSLSASNATKYVDQTSEFTPSVAYNPSYVSSKYKGYSLSSSNTSVVTVNGTKLKPTGTIGTATVTVTSTYDPTIKTTFTYKTIDRPTLVSVTISKYSSTMYVGKTQTLSVTTNPAKNLSITKTFTSSSTSVATVSSSGVVTGKAVGSTTITVSVKDKVHNITKTASVTISVEEPPVYIVNDIEIGYKHGENPIIYADAQTNLKDYFYISTFVGNSNPANKDYKFYINLSEYPGTLEEERLYTPAMNGKVECQLYYINENNVTITKDISFIVASNFNVLDAEDNIATSTTLYVKERQQFSISTLTSYYQGYKVTNGNSDLISLTYSSGNISIYAKQAGTSSFTVTPVLTIDGESTQLNSLTKTVSITANERYTSSISLKFFDSKKEEVEMSDEENNIIYINQQLTYSVVLDKETTLSQVSVKSSNTECLEIKNNTLIPKKIGDTVVSVKDKYSDLMTQYRIKVRNLVLINEKKAFLFYGLYDYNVETNTLYIVNGDWAQVRFNFDKTTTYRTVKYTIGDESIAVVGKDGTVTPIMVGNTTLTMDVSDELSNHATSTINIVVVRRNFIQNMTEFLRQVRKALGHFGAFAMLGILGTIVFYMFFRKDMFPFGLAMNISVGYFVAALTEEIQRFTPGRAAKMSDVVIDMRGYYIGAAFVLIILAIIWGIKLLVRLIKKKKAKKAE